MGRILLDLPDGVHSALLAHLLPPGSGSEQAAFVFAKALPEKGDTLFRFVEWTPIDPAGFVHHSGYFIELTDETRGRMIKRAHDLDGSLVEFHSHLASWPASFSETDLDGLEEFVPHVRWRLKGRPYMAVVVAPTSFDALAWVSGSKNPEAVEGILVDGHLHRPTGLTLKEWVSSDES